MDHPISRVIARAFRNQYCIEKVLRRKSSKNKKTESAIVLKMYFRASHVLKKKHFKVFQLHINNNSSTTSSNKS